MVDGKVITYCPFNRIFDFYFIIIFLMLSRKIKKYSLKPKVKVFLKMAAIFGQPPQGQKFSAFNELQNLDVGVTQPSTRLPNVIDLNTIQNLAANPSRNNINLGITKDSNPKVVNMGSLAGNIPPPQFANPIPSTTAVNPPTHTVTTVNLANPISLQTVSQGPNKTSIAMVPSIATNKPVGKIIPSQKFKLTKTQRPGVPVAAPVPSFAALAVAPAPSFAAPATAPTAAPSFAAPAAAPPRLLPSSFAAPVAPSFAAPVAAPAPVATQAPVAPAPAAQPIMGVFHGAMSSYAPNGKPLTTALNPTNDPNARDRFIRDLNTQIVEKLRTSQPIGMNTGFGGGFGGAGFGGGGAPGAGFGGAGFGAPPGFGNAPANPAFGGGAPAPGAGYGAPPGFGNAPANPAPGAGYGAPPGFGNAPANPAPVFGGPPVFNWS